MKKKQTRGNGYGIGAIIAAIIFAAVIIYAANGWYNKEDKPKATWSYFNPLSWFGGGKAAVPNIKK